jgi:putative endonuclease
VSRLWFLYVALCADGSLYTGISTDVHKRIETHNAGRGAKYTRSRRPVRLVYFEEHPSKSAALKAEYRFKQLPRSEKIRRIKCAMTRP